mmetsp:Transcript_69751/g.149253  ORF Transcript_69751/g.149253 Transcript_69751/m.149253 type:complete len:204 (+) Transcript_69751:2748-3359(+)
MRSALAMQSCRPRAKKETAIVGGVVSRKHGLLALRSKGGGISTDASARKAEAWPCVRPPLQEGQQQPPRLLGVSITWQHGAMRLEPTHPMPELRKVRAPCLDLFASQCALAAQVSRDLTQEPHRELSLGPGHIHVARRCCDAGEPLNEAEQEGRRGNPPRVAASLDELTHKGLQGGPTLRVGVPVLGGKEALPEDALGEVHGT